jgi:hypothetical protein
MKNVFITLQFLLFFSQLINSQINWQVGTTWHHNSGGIYSNIAHGYVIKYTEMKLVKDTILAGLSGFELTGECNCIFGSQPKFVRQADRKVWYWDDTQWELLYDFTLQTGDSLYVRYKGVNNTDSILVVVDSVSTILSNNGQPLQVQHINQDFNNDSPYIASHGTHWIEGIGSNLCLFPQIPFCDPATTLVCFEDISTLQFSWSGLSCDVITSTQSPKFLTDKIPLQPNPFHEEIQLSIPAEKIKNIEIISQNGVRYSLDWVQHNENTVINGKNLPIGMYFLRVVLDSDSVLVERILKL